MPAPFPAEWSRAVLVRLGRSRTLASSRRLSDRDHYEVEADLWQILTFIAQVRKEREVDPAIAAIHRILETADGDPRISKLARTAPSDICLSA